MPEPSNREPVKPLGVVTKDLRGYEYFGFYDSRKKPAHVSVTPGLRGSCPDEICISHGYGISGVLLSHDQIPSLIAHLQRWHDTGSMELEEKNDA